MRCPRSQTLFGNAFPETLFRNGVSGSGVPKQSLGTSRVYSLPLLIRAARAIRGRNLPEPALAQKPRQWQRQQIFLAFLLGVQLLQADLPDVRGLLKFADVPVATGLFLGHFGEILGDLVGSVERLAAEELVPFEVRVGDGLGAGQVEFGIAGLEAVDSARGEVLA